MIHLRIFYINTRKIIAVYIMETLQEDITKDKSITSENKLKQQQEIWRKICESLDLEFVPLNFHVSENSR